jgi:hypothetical protein
MSDRFDDLLSAVADSAGSAANKPGATAARKRGGQRRTRQRMAGSALAVILLGGVGSIAAVSLNHGGQTPASGATGTATSSPSAIPTTSTPMSPPQSTPVPPLTPPPPPNSTTGAPNSSNTGPWAALPHGWLPPAQVPLDNTLRWTGGSAATAQSGTSLLTELPFLYPCENNGYNSIPGAAHGFAMNSFSATADTSAGPFDGGPTADQSYVLFASASAAQYAYQTIRLDVGLCTGSGAITSANTNRPMTSVATTTATTATGFAYTFILRDDQGTPAQENGNYGASDYHTYVIRSGNLLEIVSLSGGPAVDNASADSSALSHLAADLG